MIYVIKKDGTREEFNSQKIVAAVNKSAARILYTFSDKEKEFICQFAEEHAEALGKNEIEIQEMHNIVEGALERVNPAVAKSYRDYRNYKLDFIHMMDDVYTKSQAIRYIGDKSNANTDSALVATKRSLIFNELNKELYGVRAHASRRRPRGAAGRARRPRRRAPARQGRNAAGTSLAR